MYRFHVRLPGQDEMTYDFDPTGVRLTEATAWFTARGDEAIRRACARQEPERPHLEFAEVEALREYVTVSNAPAGVTAS